MSENWERDDMQFPRVIEEAQAAGAFTEEVLDAMCASMDLERPDLEGLLDRARVVWEDLKSGKSPLLDRKYASVA